jgi:hypothetical protein
MASRLQLFWQHDDGDDDDGDAVAAAGGLMVATSMTGNTWKTCRRPHHPQQPAMMWTWT